MQKIFINGGRCPAGKDLKVDSPACRKCEKYYGACGYLFIRCAEPAVEMPKEEKPKKAGRPKGSKDKKPRKKNGTSAYKKKRARHNYKLPTR